ncbi:MAG: hypothetical protein PWQ78_567 [Petrotoga sp.]|jgi:restriction endonuclease S subunit|nr:hypothetical protein [Petrotoga sp.]
MKIQREKEMRSDMKEEFRDKIKRNRLNFDSTVPGLNRNVAYSINVNLSPLPEQQEIASNQ